MKIEDIRVYAVQVPRERARPRSPEAGTEWSADGRYFRRLPYRSLYGSSAETLLVKITTDDGLTGWGEGQSPIAPEVPQKVVEQLVAPFWIGADPFDLEVLWHRTYDGLRQRGHATSFAVDALAACNIALWDILGKATGKPVAALLGGAHRERVACYADVSRPTISERADRAHEWKERGFGAMKVSLGYGMDEDIASIAAVREAVGGEVKLLVDTHCRYDVPDAIRLGRAFERYGVWVFEEPTIPEDVPGQATIAKALDVAVASGEEFRTRFEFRERLVSRAADVLQPDVGRCGLSEAQRIADMAAAFGVSIAPHCGLGFGIYVAASVHLAAALPNLLTLEYGRDGLDYARELNPDAFGPEAGEYTLPDKPGLGVSVDEEALARFVI